MNKDELEKAIDKKLKELLNIPDADSFPWSKDLASAIRKWIKDIIPKDKIEGKHDGHNNDDRSWCYQCQCSAPEEEFTENWNYNRALADVRKALGIEND